MLANSEDAAQVWKIEDESHTCHVAFLLRSLIHAPFINSVVGKKAKVIELYKYNVSKYKRSIDYCELSAGIAEIIE